MVVVVTAGIKRRFITIPITPYRGIFGTLSGDQIIFGIGKA